MSNRIMTRKLICFWQFLSIWEVLPICKVPIISCHVIGLIRLVIYCSSSYFYSMFVLFFQHFRDVLLPSMSSCFHEMILNRNEAELRTDQVIVGFFIPMSPRSSCFGIRPWFLMLYCQWWMSIILITICFTIYFAAPFPLLWHKSHTLNATSVSKSLSALDLYSLREMKDLVCLTGVERQYSFKHPDKVGIKPTNVPHEKISVSLLLSERL